MTSSAQVLERILDQQQRIAGAHAGVAVLDAVDGLRREVQNLAESRPVPASAPPEILSELAPASKAEEPPSDGKTVRSGWFSTFR
jgi:hypothetical protein